MTQRGTRLTAALAVVISLIAVPATAAVPPGGTFTDDDGSIHEPAIEAIAAAGITNGCGGTRYCPAASVTRGEMAVFLDRALGLPPTTEAPFSDVSGAFADSINRLAAAGITNGCGGTRYCPAGAVTRAEMATFILRALGLEPIDVPPRPVPVAGNPDGSWPVPASAQAVDTSNPDRVVGNGSPASCTSAAVVQAVAQGGTIVFDCGPDPVTIVMQQTARVFNDADPDVVIDGGGLVTLSGGGSRRIIYMNTCDPALVWTTSHCDNQDHPRLTVQNLSFIDGWVDGEDLASGGGAIYARGGRLRVANSTFSSNRCRSTGPDVGGGAIRVFDQFQDQPVTVVSSTFGGSAQSRNECSNGGALSSIGVSWQLYNSLLTHNLATGVGANPARPGTPGGGNGGAIALDGNLFTLEVFDSVITDNFANEGGGGIFFVSNNRTGHLELRSSVLQRNTSAGFETAGLPGIFYLGCCPAIVEDTVLD